jgi:hypothetical protein
MGKRGYNGKGSKFGLEKKPLTKLFIGSCCKASLTCNYQHEFMSMIPISRVKVVRHLPMTYIYLNKHYCLKDIKTKKIPK